MDSFKKTYPLDPNFLLSTKLVKQENQDYRRCEGQCGQGLKKISKCCLSSRAGFSAECGSVVDRIFEFKASLGHQRETVKKGK